MKSKLTTRVLAVLTILFGICPGTHADPPGWKIIQVTDNSTVDQYPRISGSNVVWEGGGIGSESEIFFWGGGAIIQITDNDITDCFPQISGAKVAWQSGVGSDSEIFFWDGVSTIQVTNNATWDTAPQISGSNVCWRGEDGDGLMQLFFWDGSTTMQITYGGTGCVNPQISGCTIVWEGVWDPDTSIDLDVLLWNGSDIVNVSNAYGHEERPLISDGYMAWLGYDDSYNREIHLWTGDGELVTDNDYVEYDHQLSCSSVVWCAYDGENYEIYLWSAGPAMKITSGNYDNKYPQISGSNIVWEAKDTPGDDYDTDIFFWDPNSGITHLTDNDHQDRRPQISGSIVAWHGQTDPASDHEIFAAVKCSQLSADISGDCKVDFVDFGIMASEWLAEPPFTADIDDNPGVDFKDLMVLASDWLTCGYGIQSLCWD